MTRIGNQLPKSVRLEPGKRIGHGRRAAERHDGMPIPVECADQIVTRLNEVSLDLPLGKQIDNREKQERFVGRPVIGCSRPPVPPPIRVQVRKLFGVPIKSLQKSTFRSTGSVLAICRTYHLSAFFLIQKYAKYA